MSLSVYCMCITKQLLTDFSDNSSFVWPSNGSDAFSLRIQATDRTQVKQTYCWPQTQSITVQYRLLSSLGDVAQQGFCVTLGQIFWYVTTNAIYYACIRLMLSFKMLCWLVSKKTCCQLDCIMSALMFDLMWQVNKKIWYDKSTYKSDSKTKTADKITQYSDECWQNYMPSYQALCQVFHTVYIKLINVSRSGNTIKLLTKTSRTIPKYPTNTTSGRLSCAHFFLRMNIEVFLLEIVRFWTILEILTLRSDVVSGEEEFTLHEHEQKDDS